MKRTTYSVLTAAVALAGAALLPGAAVADEITHPVSNTVEVDGVEYQAEVMPGFDTSRGVQIAGAPDEARVTGRSGSLCRTGWVVPGTGSKYTSVQGCSVIGWDSTAKWTYDWQANFNSSGRICAEGKGFVKSGTKYVQTWRGLGCNSSGSGTVPWGNVAGNLQMRGYVTSVPIGWAGDFG
ncbi:hypothetical protein [Microbacterium sp. BLY]|uniref:hypothetical protein n=1 Tax=Microbacterium sp. BLY TaxID=2823280 RepID=UPI001B33EA48|nr:hypothetical protein [Microbacterium sp. BLY]MBP3977007.1 hypothetical protein [Microbacterium sp. BLY]